ncbi:nuclease-related domain-containing protein [Viridibacillus sp. NPDC096237]|uniref:nuclease-related domain-containing protein n=1 Tax=Viridibacillus sp. NPDC096237 TaxID=3390721 RepID=UPI003D01D110
MFAHKRLIQRLPADHQKIEDIKRQLENVTAGFNGECRVDQMVQEVQFNNHFFYFPNFECQLSPTRIAQIDSILITQSYILLIEIKNMRGTLHFNEQPYQLIQEIDGQSIAYHCPQMQLLRASDTFERWLKNVELQQVPIYKTIIMPNSRTVIKTPPKTVPLIMSKEVALFIQKLNELPVVINEAQLDELIHAVKVNNKAYKHRPLCENYNIPIEQVKKGVICHCGTSGIRISERTWYCPDCHTAIPNSIEQTLHDWFSICAEEITIKKCMDFLECNSRTLISRELNNCNYIALGKTKSRRFKLNNKEPLFNS